MDLPLLVGFMMLIASFDIAPSGLVPINWKKNDSSDRDSFLSSKDQDSSDSD